MSNCPICGSVLVECNEQIGSVKVDLFCPKSVDWGVLHYFTKDYLANREEIMKKEREDMDARTEQPVLQDA